MFYCQTGPLRITHSCNHPFESVERTSCHIQYISVQEAEGLEVIPTFGYLAL